MKVGRGYGMGQDGMDGKASFKARSYVSEY